MTHEAPAIRASDAEREQAVERLRAHAVDGRLTLEEFAERIDRAYAARTLDELNELSRDLPETPLAASAPRGTQTQRRLVAILGGLERRGRFRLAADTTAVTVLGGLELDLRAAEIEAAETKLTVYTVLGGAEITVPEGVDVEVRGISLLGGKEVRTGERPVPPGAPRLTVHAYTFLGGLEVRARPAR
jgi:uncharacterized protein DUF1707